MCGITDPAGCVAEAARSGLEAMAQAMADAASWMITESFTWWVDTDGGELNTGVVDAVREVTMPLTVSVAAAGMIALGIRMVLSGSSDPLVSMGEGIAKLVFWTVAGTTVLTALMRAASGFSGWVLDEASSRELGAQLLTAFDQPVHKNVGLILLLSLLGFLAGVVQWVLSLFREGALVLLAGCLPLAASGQLSLGTQWLSKITGWCLALIFWQPAASLVYFAAFAMLENARGPQEMLVGITMLVIAIFALPMLMKLFTWVVTTSGGGGGGGSSRLAGAAMAYQLRGAARSGGGRMSPGQHARMVDSSLPRQDGGGTPGAGGGRSVPPSGSAPGGGNVGSGASPTAAGAVPSTRTPTSSAAPAAAKAGPAARASGAAAAPAAVAGGGAAASAGGAATGAASAAAAGAGGAKAATAAGPIGAAAAAAVMVGAAGAKAAGRAMTEGADTPPPPQNSGSRRDAT